MSHPTKWTWWIGVPLGLTSLLALSLLLVDRFDRQLIADPLASRLEASTGRRLRMDEFDLRWGWPLTLHAENVRLANASWGRPTPMLQAPEATLTLSLGQALDGPPWAHLFLRSPRALLEHSAQGQWNWNMDTTRSEPQEAFVLPFTLTATGGRLVYAGADTPAVELRLRDLSLTTANADDSSLALRMNAAAGDMPLSLQSTMDMEMDRYAGQASLRAGASSLSGDFSIDNTGAAPRLRARLDSEVLDPLQLAALLPASTPAASEQPTMALPRLPDMAADIELNVAAVRLPGHRLERLRAGLVLSEGVIELAPLEGEYGGAGFSVSAALDTLAPQPVLQVDAGIPRLALADLPDTLRLSAQPGAMALQVTARVHMPERRLPLTPATLLARLAVPESRLAYTRGDAEYIARARIEPAGGAASVSLEAPGLELPPLSATLSAPPLSQIMSDTSYGLELLLRSGSARASASARLEDLLDPASFQVQLSLSGDDLPALPAFGFAPPPLAPFSLAGTLARTESQWTLNGLDAAYGESRLSGAATYRDDNGRPRITLDLRAPLLDLRTLPDSLAAARQGSDGDTGDAASNWVPVAVARMLRGFDADLELAARRLVLPGLPELTQVELGARLARGRLEADTVAFDTAGGRVSGTLTAQAGRTPVGGQINVNLDELRLSRFGDTFTPLEERLGLLSGQLRIDIAESAPGEVPGTPTLGRLSLDGTRLEFRDAEAGTDLSLRLDTQDPGQGLRLRAEGRYMNEPVSLDMTGDPLLALRDPREPYDMRLELVLADTRLGLDGQVARPWAPQSARFDLSASGGNPTRLREILGPVFIGPLPPYEVEGMLSYADQRIAIDQLRGQVGDSDIRGSAALNLAGDVPAVEATLRSDRLDLDDFAGIIGGTPAAGPGETASPQQEAADRREAERDYVLPRQRFDLPTLEGGSADIEYTASSIEVASVPLDSLAMKVRLHDGRLQADPLRFRIGDGLVRLRLDLHTRDNELQGLIDVDARGVNLDTALAQLDIAADSFGVVGAQGKFWVRGDSTASLLGSADGGAILLMTGGALDSLLVEASGLDFGEALLAAGGLTDPVPIDCAYASLHARDGIIETERFVVDTSDTTYFIEGSANLRQESLDLTLFPEAKDLGLPAADTPLRLIGTFKNPDVSLLTGGLAARGLGAVALSSLVGPLAALVPFVELGKQSEPPVCRGWVEQLREERLNGA